VKGKLEIVGLPCSYSEEELRKRRLCAKALQTNKEAKIFNDPEKYLRAVVSPN
jgi:hypothetical protein